jgi:hypothetical protein
MFEELFEGQELTADFKAKVQEMFEAAVTEAVAKKETALAEELDIKKATLVAESKTEIAKVQEVAEQYRAEVVAEYAKKIEEATAQYDQKLEEYMTAESTKVDEFMNYVSEKWLEENKLAVEQGARAELVESFLSGLHGLFKEHYVEVPEDKVDVVAQLTQENEEIKSKLNDTIGENVELKTFIRGKAKDALVAEAAEGLAETQVERLESIAEGLEFKDEESFKTKLNTVRDSIVAESKVETPTHQKPKGAVDNLTEGFDVVPKMDDLITAMAKYGTKR